MKLFFAGCCAVVCWAILIFLWLNYGWLVFVCALSVGILANLEKYLLG